MSRLIKISATGEQLPIEATDHVIVLDTKTNLMHTRGYALPNEIPFADAQAAVDALNAQKFGGFDDWRRQAPDEAFSIVDHSRYAPAINTDFFDCGEYDCVWTEQVTPWSSDSVFIVIFYYGNVYDYHRDDKAFVRAVRSVAPAGQ